MNATPINDTKIATAGLLDVLVDESPSPPSPPPPFVEAASGRALPFGCESCPVLELPASAAAAVALAVAVVTVVVVEDVRVDVTVVMVVEVRVVDVFVVLVVVDFVVVTVVRVVDVSPSLVETIVVEVTLVVVVVVVVVAVCVVVVAVAVVAVRVVAVFVVVFVVLDTVVVTTVVVVIVVQATAAALSLTHFLSTILHLASTISDGVFALSRMDGSSHLPFFLKKPQSTHAAVSLAAFAVVAGGDGPDGEGGGREGVRPGVALGLRVITYPAIPPPMIVRTSIPRRN